MPANSRPIFNLKLLYFWILASMHMLNPAQAGHLQKVLPAIPAKKAQHHYSQAVTQRFNRWIQLVATYRNRPPLEKLQQVNTFFNQMKWAEDQELWQARDYWATPLESLIRNAGDCEDFSIAKYFTLLELGIPREQLKVTFVRLNDTNLSHMVLAYYATPSADPLILDNINPKLLHISERPDLTPRFHFNEIGVWKAGAPLLSVATPDRIQRWADLLDRVKNQEGILTATAETKAEPATPDLARAPGSVLPR